MEGTPPHDYYRIDEAGKILDLSVDKLLRYGAEGKMEFAIRLKPRGYVTNISLKCTSCGTIENVPGYGDIYPLSVKTLKDMWGDTKKTFTPIILCKCTNDTTIECACDANDPSFDEDEHLSCVDDLLVKHDEIEELKKAYRTDVKQTVSVVESNQQNSYQKEEAYPSLGDPIDKRVYGLTDLSKFFGLTPDYLKRCWKKDGYPFNKSKKKLFAYPSQMRAFRPSKEKK